MGAVGTLVVCMFLTIVVVAMVDVETPTEDIWAPIVAAVAIITTHCASITLTCPRKLPLYK